MVNIARRKTAPWHRRLYLPCYRISDAARYVGISPQLLSSWHRPRASGDEPPLPEREFRRPLSYLELIEAAVVAAIRRTTPKIGLGTIRQARAYMAQTFNSEYPFVEYQFKTDGYHLLMELAQAMPDLDTRDLIVTDAGGQLGWNDLMAHKLYEFDYDEEYELALRWHAAGRDSPVSIDPRVAFGAPTVNGIATWILRGRMRAGEEISEIKEEFPRLDHDEIAAGLRFEGIEIAA